MFPFYLEILFIFNYYINSNKINNIIIKIVMSLKKKLPIYHLYVNHKKFFILVFLKNFVDSFDSFLTNSLSIR
jgi:hypothetical protein